MELNVAVSSPRSEVMRAACDVIEEVPLGRRMGLGKH